jgi:small subunit ribosomal protein S17
MEQRPTTVNKAPKFKGIVESDAMDKTIVVAVETLKTHPKYRKQYRSTKRYKVHDAENRYKVGDVVVFRECRPMSKDKRHQVIETKE